ncbi:MAG: TRAP transporter large permease subunit [Steroidobacteraceae bacterium]|nr:TRAP transporter large permease subunit [Steroidobacteraceae bacterium]
MTGLLHRAENLLLAAALAALVLLGVASATRALADADDLIRHLTLLVGMLGGMAAARENRLLAMGTVAQALPPAWKPAVAAFTGLVATTVTALLTLAAWQFVRGEAPSSSTLAFGVPRIALQALMPLGFAVIAWRIACHSTAGWPGRAAVLAAAIAVTWAVSQLDGGIAAARTPLLAVLGAAILLGAPIFVGLAGIALVFFIAAGDPIASVPLDHYDQVTNPLLATLPLFTLAGYIVAASGAARRLVWLLQAWSGHLRGGPAVITVLACAFFTAFTGGSGVTILALGGLLMPILLHSRYADRASLGLVTGAGSLGVLFAPCLPLILYSIVAQVSIEQMFLAGAVPGLLLVALACGWGIAASPQGGFRPGFSWRRVRVTTWRAKWELLLPVVPLVLIFGGYALPVPAAAITAAYAIAVAAFVNRDLPKGEALVEVLRECGLLVGGVLLILGAAMGLTNLLVTEHVPDRLTAWISTAIDSKWLFLLALNLFLLAVGCLMDIFSAIIVVAPLVVPVALAFGVDPVHLGIILLANLELGYLTPPVGLNLFMSASRFRRPVLEVARASLPMLAVLAVGVVLITVFPQLSLALPQWFAARG